MENRLLLNTQEAAKLVGLSPRKVSQLVDEGRLPVVRIDRSVRFRESDLQNLIREHVCIRRSPLQGSPTHYA